MTTTRRHITDCCCRTKRVVGENAVDSTISVAAAKTAANWGASPDPA